METDEFDAGRLPDEIEIPEEIEDDIDAISDYITDMTGFCHKGFQLDSEARLTDSKGTDMEMLKKICYLLHIDETSDMALPLVFYRNHLLISADYFRSDEALFKLIYTNIFKTKPENMVSFRDETYISLSAVLESLEAGQRGQAGHKTFTKELIIPYKTALHYQKLLDNPGSLSLLSLYDNIIHIADFDDGYSIKFRLHRRVTDRKWRTEAVLYDGNGRQMSYCESEDHFIGEWILKNPDGTEYCVHVRSEQP